MFLIKRRVHGIEVRAVHLFKRKPDPLTEALIVYDLALSQESDNVVYVGVVAQTQDVVLGHSGLLFGS